MLILPNLIYRVNSIYSKFQKILNVYMFVVEGWYETKKVKLKFTWKYKECKLAKTFLKKNKAAGLLLPTIKT